LKYAYLKDIKKIAKTPKNSLAISIFLPTHKISNHDNLMADNIRMKNAIQDLTRKLHDKGIRENEMSMYLDRLQVLYEDKEFWKNRDNGLALYLKKDNLEIYDLPIEIEAQTYISDSFIISPLLAAKADDFNYMVLDLNLNKPRLFLASQNDFEEIFSSEMPKDIETALRLDENQTQLQHGTSMGGSKDAHHHGHGAAKDNSDKDVKNYFRLLSKTLWRISLHESNLPLIVAGEESHAHEFINQSKYKKIHGDILSGNHEHESENDLHAKTWRIMQEQIKNDERVFNSSFEIAKHNDKKRALEKTGQILRAAKQGRIMTLAFSVTKQTFDSVVRRMEQQFKITLPKDSKTLNDIEKSIREVINNGGNIRSLLFNTNESADYKIRAISR
jgi:hypothetical protein